MLRSLQRSEAQLLLCPECCSCTWVLELNVDAVSDQQKRTPDTQAEPKVAFLPLLMQNIGMLLVSCEQKR